MDHVCHTCCWLCKFGDRILSNFSARERNAILDCRGLGPGGFDMGWLQISILNDLETQMQFTKKSSAIPYRDPAESDKGGSRLARMQPEPEPWRHVVPVEGTVGQRHVASTRRPCTGHFAAPARSRGLGDLATLTALTAYTEKPRS